MLHISVENTNEETALKIRDFLISICGKEKVEFDIESRLTFIDVSNKYIGSYVHKTLSEDFKDIIVLEIYEIGKSENKLQIDINLINSYWG